MKQHQVRRLRHCTKIILLVLFGHSSSHLNAQQFNSDNYVVMPHGTGTFVITNGERNAAFVNSFGLIPRFEFFVQGNLFWENEKTESPQHFTATLYAKYSLWVNTQKSSGVSVFLGFGKSPGYYTQKEFLTLHKNYWTAVVYTLPLFNKTIYWDFMPGGMVDIDYKGSKNAAWGFTYSSRINVYKLIPKTAIVAEIFGTEGSIYSAPEYKIGLRYEPNDFIIPAITYGNTLSGTGGAGFEIGLVIFTPQYIKKSYIQNNHIEY